MNRFAFIIHPLEASDVARKYPGLGWLPSWLIEGITRRMPPVVASQITGLRSGNKSAEGFFVACPLTSRQMISLPEDFVLERIQKACLKAADLGAKIVGLGAMTSVVGDAGITLAKKMPVAVTTGNTYTIATAMEGIEEALRLLDRDIHEAHVAVVGATGSIGSVCARMLAKEAKAMTLIARNPDKLNRLANRILYESGLAVSISTRLDRALAHADVVVSVSSSADALIEPEYLKSGAVVCDVARPRDVSKKVAEKRRDVLVIEGGVVRVPDGVKMGFNFGFPAGMAYACMAETMLLALEGRFESFSLGREISMDKVDEIRRLAKKHGFSLAGLRSFERPLLQEDVERVKKHLKTGDKIQVCLPLSLGKNNVNPKVGQEAY